MANIHWRTCQVGRAGMTEDGVVLVQLKDVSSDGAMWSDYRFFSAVPQIKKEILTIALSAMAAGFLVNVDLTAPDEWSTINRIYATRSP